MATPNVLETKAGNGLGPRTQIISMPTADQAAMDAQIAELSMTHTIAGTPRHSRRYNCSSSQGTADAPATLTGGATVTVEYDFA